MDAHEVLVAARNLIEREGWAQYKFKGPGPRCVNGLISAANLGGTAFTEACDAFAHANGLRDLMENIDWNNAPGRTKDEVLAAFDRAISATAPKPDLSFLSNQSHHREVVGSGTGSSGSAVGVE